MAFVMLVVQADIGIHLPHVLMRQFAEFEINQQKALEFEVVKNQVEVKILVFHAISVAGAIQRRNPALAPVKIAEGCRSSLAQSCFPVPMP